MKFPFSFDQFVQNGLTSGGSVRGGSSLFDAAGNGLRVFEGSTLYSFEDCVAALFTFGPLRAAQRRQLAPSLLRWEAAVPGDSFRELRESVQYRGPFPWSCR